MHPVRSHFLTDTLTTGFPPGSRGGATGKAGFALPLSCSGKARHPSDLPGLRSAVGKQELELRRDRTVHEEKFPVPRAISVVRCPLAVTRSILKPGASDEKIRRPKVSNCDGRRFEATSSTPVPALEHEGTQSVLDPIRLSEDACQVRARAAKGRTTGAFQVGRGGQDPDPSASRSVGVHDSANHNRPTGIQTRGDASSSGACDSSDV